MEHSDDSTPARPGPRDRAPALVASVLLVLPLLAGWILETRNPDAYYRIIPEDGPVEWATFWAEIVACALNGALAWKSRRAGFGAWWFAAGLALFCFLVAGEEISWGQRLLGFQPSAYFLAHNVQLEENVHNLFPPEVWSSGIVLLVGGFGVALPLLQLARRPAELAERLALYGPPVSWTPGFALVLATYALHPYYLCEEVVEMQIGVGLALAALSRFSEFASSATSRSVRMISSFAVVVALGLATTAATDRGSDADEALVDRANAELEALRQDFVAMRASRGGRFVTACDLQARLHSLDPDRVLLPGLADGAFEKLVSPGAPKRAQYLLDPWNMPYWISDQCDSAARYIMLFSFGPNRRRESTDWAPGGDDVAVYAFHLGEPRPGDWHALSQVDQVEGR